MDLSGTVARVGTICRRFRIDSLALQLAACEELLKDGGVVDVTVLGQFKAGKSSFLNGLIGGAVVPVDVLPSTAVITRIGYGQRERGTVHGLAGESFEIPLIRLAEFVTERGNPANEKRVAVVDVELPALAPYERIRFVDTPGLGSIFAHNTRVSKEWMPRVGAALVAVSVNHPLSEDDLLLLNDVSLHTPEAAILLTKADLVSGEELASVVEFTRSQATSRTGKEWRILPVSNRPGFEGMRREVAEYLRNRIGGRREEAFREIERHKVRALAAGCREYLLLAERAAEAAGAARSDLIEALASERRGFGPVKGELRLLCNHLQAEVRTAADERFHAYHGEVTGRVTEALREAMTGWKGHLGRVTREFEGWLADAMMEEMGAVSLHGEGHLAGFLFRAQASVER
ncbi:MAG TPA: dynamin family protein, partial [Candidatus Deferrimicrobium sp.]